jgi:predicted nucleotidyltransferase
MNEILKKMKNLAWKIANEKKREKGIVAILLFGSVAKGNIHPKSDIDLVFVKDSQENLIKRKQIVRNGIKIDLWKHSISFYEHLFRKNWPPEQMFSYSLFLNILQECKVLYDRESKFEKYKENAIVWNWPRNCKAFIKSKLEEALNNYKEGKYDKFEKLVYLRKLFLLYICKRLLNLGKPVSIRNKDYYLKCKEYSYAQEFERIFGKIPDRNELSRLIKKVMNIFHREVKNREQWTELKDAKNHFSNKEDFIATISLQNGAYYLGCVGLSNRNVDMENKGFLNPKAEIELIRKTEDHWMEFYDIYQRAHNINAWDYQEIDSIFHYLSKISTVKT